MLKAPERTRNQKNTQEDLEIVHTMQEIGNVYRCVTIEDAWLKDRENPSILYISELHAKLFDGIEPYRKKGISPVPPGVFRKEDIKVSGEPENFYVRGLDVDPIMGDYSKDLDSLIQTLPRFPIGSVEEVIKRGAWAYYVFERIHPFLDGNGRLGRMILRRILRGSGFKDIIFSHEPRGLKRNTENRSKHLDAMNQVDKTGNLAYLEIYLGKLLANLYKNSGSEQYIYTELQKVIANKSAEIASQNGRAKLSEIWSHFGNMDIHGEDNGNSYGQYLLNETS